MSDTNDRLLAQFRAHAQDAQSRIETVTGWDDAFALAARLHHAPPLLSPALHSHDPGPAGRFRRVDPTDPVASAADAAVGVSLGRLAVAETGSVLLVEPTLAERAVSMLCHHSVQIVPRDALVPSLDDVAAWLAAHAAQAPYATLHTGPSRTADIERSLTIGVQGPREVLVVVVG